MAKKKSKEENPFFAINSMSEDGENGILSGKVDESSINEYLTNTSFSLQRDCIHFADRANRFHHTPKRWLYHFYHEVVPKRKRWAKWPKKDTTNQELMNSIKDLSYLNEEQSFNIIKLFDNETKRKLIKMADKGGISKNDPLL